MWHFRVVKTYSDPSYIFSGAQSPPQLSQDPCPCVTKKLLTRRLQYSDGSISTPRDRWSLSLDYKFAADCTSSCCRLGLPFQTRTLWLKNGCRVLKTPKNPGFGVYVITAEKCEEWFGLSTKLYFSQTDLGPSRKYYPGFFSGLTDVRITRVFRDEGNLKNSLEF